MQDSDALVRFVTWKTLHWHHENCKPLSIAVGAEFFIYDGSAPKVDNADFSSPNGCFKSPGTLLKF